MHTAWFNGWQSPDISQTSKQNRVLLRWSEANVKWSERSLVFFIMTCSTQQQNNVQTPLSPDGAEGISQWTVIRPYTQFTLLLYTVLFTNSVSEASLGSWVCWHSFWLLFKHIVRDTFILYMCYLFVLWPG